MGQALPPHAVSAAFGKYISALPIVVPVDLHENAPCLKNTHSLISDFWLFREAEPEDIHWRADILERQCRHLSQTRVPAIRSDHQSCADILSVLQSDTTDAPSLKSEEHTSELQSLMAHLVCRLLLEKKKQYNT